MGKRHLATVGTHEDFYAEIFDERTGSDPSCISHCASRWDAANSYFSSMFNNSGGMIREAAIAVWPVNSDISTRTVFDARAVITLCKEADAEEDEYEVFLDVQQRL